MYTELIEQLQLWGYPIMLFLMVIEGPITTIIAAFLASMGFFEWQIVYIISILSDLIGDTIWYFIGFFGGRAILRKFRKKLRIKKSTIAYLENKFKTDGAKIIFYVKASTGLSLATFMLAGAMKMNFRRFIQFSFLGGLLWSGFLVVLGYFFGELAEEIEKYIKFAGWLIFSFAILILVFINLSKKKKTREIIRIFNKREKEKKKNEISK